MATNNTLDKNFILERLREKLRKKVVETPSEVVSGLGIEGVDGLTPIFSYLDTEKKLINRLVAKKYQKDQIKDFMRNYRSLSFSYRDLTEQQRQMGFGDAFLLSQTRTQFQNLTRNYKTGTTTLTNQLKKINDDLERLQTFQQGYDRRILQWDLLTRETKEELKDEYKQVITRTKEGEAAYNEAWEQLFNRLNIPKDKRTI